MYRAGMAVEGAGLGALSPVAEDRGSGSAPRDLHAAMSRLRGSWAIATTTFGHMLVERPTDSTYDRIAKSAIDIQAMASCLATEGARQLGAHEGHGHAAGAQGRGAEGEAGHGGEGGGRGGADADPMAAQAARSLGAHAGALEHAARGRDCHGVAESLAEVTNVCARCHAALRWAPDGT